MATYEAPSIKVFVSTYRTYNEKGSHGQWFNLSDYVNKDEFEAAAIKYANEVLKDSDPELMYLDFDSTVYDLGRQLISEDYISGEAWDVLDMEPHELEIIDAYMAVFGNYNKLPLTELLQKANEHYLGYWPAAEDMAFDLMNETNSEQIEALPNLIKYHIDYKGIARDLLLDGISEANGHYFHDH